MATADIRRSDAAPLSAPPQIAAGDAQVLAVWLARAARRRNTLVVARHVVRALLPVTIGGALAMLAYRFYFLDAPTWLLPVLLVLSALVGVFFGWRRRAGSFQAAREADAHFKLHDLLASAHAFAAPPAKNSRAVATPFVPPLVSQAAQQTRALSVRELYPWKLDRPGQVLGVAALALVGTSLMPNNPYFLSEERRNLNTTLKKEGEKLQRAAVAARQDRKLSQNARAQIAARRLEALAQRMQGGRMTKKQALLSLDQLKREMERSGQGKPNPSSPSPADLQRLRDALAGGAYQTDEAKRMQRDLKQSRDPDAAKSLDELARKLEQNGFGSQQERDKAANDLEEAARALRRSGTQNDSQAKQLEDAAKALRQNQNPNQQQQNQQNGQSGQQNQSGQNGQQQGQQGQQQKGQQGQGQQGQQGQGQQGQQGGQNGASDSLRKMAEDLRSNGGSGEGVRDMMKRIEEAERSAGGANSGQGQSGPQGQQGQSGQNGQQGGNGKGQAQNGKNGKGQNGQGNPGSGNNRGGTGTGRGGDDGTGRQTVTPGGDLRPSDPNKGTGGGAGLGPRSKIKGSQGGGGGISKQRAAKSNDSRRWADVWSDRIPDARKKIDRVKGKMTEDGQAEKLETRGEARGGVARTPYYDVYPSYKREAEDAIARENVPPAYRDSVKQYFDRIKPE
jgi:hypothetical protein